MSIIAPFPLLCRRVPRLCASWCISYHCRCLGVFTKIRPMMLLGTVDSSLSLSSFFKLALHWIKLNILKTLLRFYTAYWLRWDMQRLGLLKQCVYHLDHWFSILLQLLALIEQSTVPLLALIKDGCDHSIMVGCAQLFFLLLLRAIFHPDARPSPTIKNKMKMPTCSPVFLLSFCHLWISMLYEQYINGCLLGIMKVLIVISEPSIE